MDKIGFSTLFFFFLIIAGILAYFSDIGFLLMIILIGLIMLLFSDFFSKNLIMLFRGVSLFITPKSRRKIMPFYTPQEFFGDKGGIKFVRVVGIIILVVGILFYIFP